VSAPVSVSIAHRLGKAEATRRLKDGLARTKGHLGALISVEQEVWSGDTLQFQMRALGQTAAGSIEVREDSLRIEVTLPWLLAKAAERILPVMRQQTALLLEKK
jgi:putative polyhydroxyalkanoic acid system protein